MVLYASCDFASVGALEISSLLLLYDDR